MAILRPSSDLITVGWASSPSGTLSSCIDESTYSDTDYIATSTAGQIARVSLGTYTTSGGTHSLKYRACSPEADRGLIARVLELGQPPAIILKRDVWTSRPQTSAGIDWNNPITRGLELCITPSSNGKNIVGKESATIESHIVKTPKSGGIAWTGFNDASNYEISYVPPSGLTEGSALYIAISPNTSSVQTMSNLGQGLVSFFPYSNGLWYSADFANTRYFSGITNTSLLNQVTKPYAVATAGKNNSHATYMNGQLLGESSAVTFSIPATIKFGSADTGSFSLAGGMYAAAFWSRRLSNIELQKLTENPWQIFRKQSKPIFIDAPKVIATQTTTSGAIATTPTDYTLTLSSGEAASITNGAELALEVEST